MAEPTATTSVTVYAKRAIGDVAPVRIIAGSRTGLQFPSAVAVDARGQRYVADRTANSVTACSSNARGNAAPLRTIVGARTGLNLPTGLALDGRGDVCVVNRWKRGADSHDRVIDDRSERADQHRRRRRAEVYVTNLGGRSVTLFARGASGDAAPVRITRGKRTRLTAAFAIAVDPAGNVYVVNSDDKGVDGVLVFDPGANGNVAPIRILAGSETKLETPSGVSVDPQGDIFVSDHGGSNSAGAIRIYAKGANGNAAPLYSIAGSATRLRPYGLTIDRTGEIDVVNKTD